jgi:arginyl-tRNA synthetase
VLQAFASVAGQGITVHKTAVVSAITKAVNYLRRTLVTKNHYDAYGDFNTNSTGYAAQGLIAVGKPHEPIKAWLVSKLATDGGIQSAWSAGAGDIFATAQAAIVLAGKSYVDMVTK